jgi:HrpA-like RNA helicase
MGAVREGETSVIYATEGVVLREVLYGPMLEEYGVVMVDEVHERTINTDILLALLKKIAKTNKRSFKLKLIISSASIDALLWKNFFDFSSDDGLHIMYIIF